MVQGLVLPDVGEIGKLDVVEVYFVLGLVLRRHLYHCVMWGRVLIHVRF